MFTVSTLLSSALAQGLPRIDAQMLLLHACGRDTHDRTWLVAHASDALTPAQCGALEVAIQRRLSCEPVAYITGRKAFYGLELSITPAVLDPRADTEALVDWALELIPADQAFKVLDLGTGSGAVALAIRSLRPLAQLVATEASPEALAVARSNALAHQLPVRFVQADAHDSHWFSALGDEMFDLIVSNPPYIAQGDAHLAALRHEPVMALTSGKDGLDAIRSIIAHAPAHLRPGGHLLLEHGYDQAKAVRELFSANKFTASKTRQDLASTDRCTGAML